MGFTVPELRHVMAAYETVREYDLVHDHTVLGPIYGGGDTGQPVVTTIHGPLGTELIDIYRAIAGRAELIAISNAQRAPAPDIPVARVIHHGVDVAEFPYGDGEGGYVLFLGRLSPDKGAHRAVQAAQKAGVPLLLAGKCREPWERSYFDREISPHLGDGVEYVGEVPHEEKLRLLAGARATLFPIRWNEPFGLVMIESLACGTPVLAFAEGAAVEVVQDGRTGHICRDETEMAEAIGAVDSIDRADFRVSGEGYFSLDRMIREHVELFEELLAAR